MSQHRIDMFSNPVHSQGFDRLVQACLTKAVRLMQGGKGRSSLACVSAKDGPRGLSDGISLHASEAWSTNQEEVRGLFTLTPP